MSILLPKISATEQFRHRDHLADVGKMIKKNALPFPKFCIFRRDKSCICPSSGFCGFPISCDPPVETPRWGVLWPTTTSDVFIISDAWKFIIIIGDTSPVNCDTLLWRISKTPQRGVSTKLSLSITTNQTPSFYFIRIRSTTTSPISLFIRSAIFPRLVQSSVFQTELSLFTKRVFPAK